MVEKKIKATAKSQKDSNETKKQLKIGLSAIAFSVVGIVIVGLIRNKTGFDPFGKTVIKSKFLGNLFGESENYSGWPISHFVLYLFLGALAPKLWFLWFILGIIWEILEALTGKILKSDSTSKSPVEKIYKQYGAEWVAGKSSDVLFNSAGLFVGFLISKIVNRTRFKKKRGSQGLF